MLPKSLVNVFLLSMVVLNLETAGENAQTGCGYSFTPDQTSGAIYSPNYPFNYQPGLVCDYVFLFNPDQKDMQVCLTFLRFQLYTDDDCLKDYLVFPGGVRYCGPGRIASVSRDPKRSKDSVWMNVFCWDVPLNGSQLKLSFVSQSDRPQSGFYAEFESSIHEPEDKHVPDECEPDQVATPIEIQSGNESDVPGCMLNCPNGNVCNLQKHPDCSCHDSAPCRDDQYTCFNRKCISLHHRCDSKDDCGDDSDENYMHARCEGRDLLTVVSCDFELDDTCGFLGMSSWRRVSSPPGHPSGPFADHTIGEGGHYITTDYLDLEPGTAITFFTQHIPELTEAGSCLSFWYQVVGDNPGQLRVTFGDVLLWQSERGAPIWHSAKIHMPTFARVPQTLTFEATRGRGSDDMIAIDDMFVHEGACQQVLEPSCAFGEGTCGWHQEGHTDTKAVSDWQIISHDTLGPGRYLYLEIDETTSFEKVSLYSPHIPSLLTRDYCFRFRLYMSSTSFKVELHRLVWQNNYFSNIWESRTVEARIWTDVALTVSGRSVFQLVILLKNGNTGDQIAIDDVSITVGHCDNDNLGNPTPVLTECSVEQFHCPGSSVCIPNVKLCDGARDCEGGEDEAHENCDDERRAAEPSPPASGDDSSGSLSTVAVMIVVAVAVVLVLVVAGLSAAFIHTRRRHRAALRERSLVAQSDPEPENSAETQNTALDDIQSRDATVDVGLSSAPVEGAVAVRPDLSPLQDSKLYDTSIIRNANGDIVVFEPVVNRQTGAFSIDNGGHSVYNVRCLPAEETNMRYLPPRYSFIMRTNNNRDGGDDPRQTAAVANRSHSHESSLMDNVYQPPIDRGPQVGPVEGIYTISGSPPTYEQVLQESSQASGDPSNAFSMFSDTAV